MNIEPTLRLLNKLIFLTDFLTNSSEFEGKEGSVIWLDAGGGLEQVDEALSLSGEAVDDVLVVVGRWSLEEEAQVGENWAHLLVVDRHSGEKLTKDDHIDHQRSGEE